MSRWKFVPIEMEKVRFLPKLDLMQLVWLLIAVTWAVAIWNTVSP